GDGVARPVYYSATAHAAVVRQPTDGPLAPAPASQADGESLAADVLRVLSGVIKPFDASRRLISLGCGDGAVLDVLHARTGWRVHGVDPDADRAAAARGKGYAVYESAVEDAATAVPAVEPFDVVLVEPHALAASADPLRLLRRARHLLTTGGVIVLAGANLDAGGFAEQGRAWPAWDVAGTRYVLSPKAVRLLARDAQLEPVRVRTLTNGAVDRTGRGERFVAVLKYGGG
ncbi:MAG TPA: methyltransferase domain-containing protein, partial [Tepidisphaeraceae bacterium]|nr:methyltransferase domain-containing protein [Tepidisphaeraceae bacterium]